MRASKELVTAVGTLALAVGIGFVMQSTDEAKDRYGIRTAPAAQASTVTGSVFMPELRKVQLTSANEQKPVQTPVQQASNFTTSCQVETSAQVLPGALVQIILNAPCKRNERLIVHHNGLMFTDRTNDLGVMTATIPALAEDAVFIIAFEAGKGAVIQTRVEDMQNLHRAVLQWSGTDAFELHALEFGADYGSSGHVWSGVNSTSEVGQSLDRGFVVQLGDPQVMQPLMAEVYTYPAETGPVDLRVETAIHEKNCGADIEVQSIQYAKGSLFSEDILLSMPDCSAAGELLVLANLVGNEITASR